MASEPLFLWREVVIEYVGFLAAYFMLGPVGFRYGVLRGWLDERTTRESPHLAAFRRAAVGAAGIGLAGAALGLIKLVADVVKESRSKHLTVASAASEGMFVAQVVLLVVVIVGFLLARRQASRGWPVAAVAALAFQLRNVASGHLKPLINPLHVLGSSLWLGTLFALLACGIAEMLRPTVPSSERESAVAQMVNRFSTLALFSAALLAITGLTTAWTHLKYLAALWTTPYGYALIAKLCVVAMVAALGAWNWRRVRPSLGHEGTALQLRRSASAELAFAGIVLAITGILVSLPSPKLPK